MYSAAAIVRVRSCANHAMHATHAYLGTHSHAFDDTAFAWRHSDRFAIIHDALHGDDDGLIKRASTSENRV